MRRGSQLASISAFTDTMTNVNTTISAANTALQALSTLGGQVVQELRGFFAGRSGQYRTDHQPRRPPAPSCHR